MTAMTNAARAGWRPWLWGGAAALLAAPAVAMRFTAEVAWTASDFLFMGVLLLGACALFEAAARMPGHRAYRAGAGVAILAALLLVWANAAVGLLGDEGNAANLIFAGVILVAAVGAVLARVRAAGMARAMIAAAAAQAAAGAIGLAAGWASPGRAGIYEVTIGTVLFGALWLIAAGSFARAARQARQMESPGSGRR